jgi:hypothetical protein
VWRKILFSPVLHFADSAFFFETNLPQHLEIAYLEMVLKMIRPSLVSGSFSMSQDNDASLSFLPTVTIHIFTGDSLPTAERCSSVFFWFATIARVPNLSAVETFPENVDPQHSQTLERAGKYEPLMRTSKSEKVQSGASPFNTQ